MSRILTKAVHYYLILTLHIFVPYSPKPNLEHVDHLVGNQPDLQMTSAAEWYVHRLQKVHPSPSARFFCWVHIFAKCAPGNRLFSMK